MLKSFSQYLLEKEDADALVNKFASAIANNSKVAESPKGSNNSPEIKQMLSNVGINSPAAWCAAFVSWIFDKTYDGNPPFKKSASVISMWKNAPASAKIDIDQARQKPELIQPGMIFIKSRGGASSGKGHTGIVLGYESDRLKTIEGNTNDELSGEGDRVGINIEKGRQLSDKELLGFIDPFLEYRSEPGFNAKLTAAVNDSLRGQGTNADLKAPAASTQTATPNAAAPVDSGETEKMPGATDEEIKSNPVMRGMIIGIVKMAVGPVISKLAEVEGKDAVRQTLDKYAADEKKDVVSLATSIVGSINTIAKFIGDSSKIAAEFGTTPEKMETILAVLKEVAPTANVTVKSGGDFKSVGQWNPGKSVENTTISGDVTMSLTGEKQANAKALIAAMERHGITNPYTKIAILGVVGKESNFIPKGEGMDYSKERLPEVWGVFSKTGQRVPKGQGASQYNELATQYERNPEKLANFVYGQKPDGMKDNAYGNTQPGDGWKYRGRGFNQITFKAAYQKYQQLLSAGGKVGAVDIVNNPDQLNDINVAAEAAVLYMLDRAKDPKMLSKYGTSDINGFKDQDTALKAITNANAGWGNTIEGSTAYNRAKEYTKLFSPSPTSQMA